MGTESKLRLANMLISIDGPRQPELLAPLALKGCIVTIDAMGTQANIAQAIRDRGTDYVPAIKDNQPTLADSKHGTVMPSINWTACTDPSNGLICSSLP